MAIKVIVELQAKPDKRAELTCPSCLSNLAFVPCEAPPLAARWPSEAAGQAREHLRDAQQPCVVPALPDKLDSDWRSAG